MTPGLKPRQFSVARYDKQEFHATVQSRVAGEQCFLVGSITPPECQTLSGLLGQALNNEGASRVTGIRPYLDYSRKDKVSHSLATAQTGALLRAYGFDEIWT